MKKLSFASLAFATLIAGPAVAADLGAPAYTRPAPFEPWTGFYIGGDVGWSDIRQNATTAGYPQPGFGGPPIVGAGVSGLGNLPTAHTLNGSGALGGAHLGYNWQVTNWLYGLEGDIMGLNYHPSDTETVFATLGGAPTPAFNMLVTAQNRWQASIRGRLGWVSGPLLLYGTAGMAFTNSSYTATAGALPAVMQPVGATVTFWDTKTGYVVGGGAEWMLTPSWLLRAEYLHYGFDSSSSSSLPLVFATATDACAPGACFWNVNSSRQNIDTVRVGLSYKFGATAPAASK